MEWTQEQRSSLAHEYARIGYKPGEMWPAPPEHLSPADLLDLFRTIPDGAGRAGFLTALSQLPHE
jgi:hypothetical protein